jgi:hypothetical protein
MPLASIVPAEAAHVTPDDPFLTVAINETVWPVPVAAACGLTLTLMVGVGAGVGAGVSGLGADPELQPLTRLEVMRTTQKQKL